MTRVLIAGFKHETNTFSKLPTDLAAYRARAFHLGDEVPQALAGTRTEPAAFLDFCRREGWSAVHPIYADATPSGRVTEEAFDFVAGRIVDAITDAGGVDAVMLSLHGAMVCEHVDDGEGELLAIVRRRVGPDVPIAATLDLHANVTQRMAENCDILISYRTYPHVDQVEIATQAAELVKRALAGEIRPAVHIARSRLLDGADHGRTTAPGPMTEVLESADKLLAAPGVLATSVCAGFALADIHDTGPSAIVVGDRGVAGAPYQDMAAGLMDEVWDSRHRSTVQTISAAAAIERIRAAGPPAKPVVIADFADNPGGGGYGDSTGLLRAMIEARLEGAAFATIYDPASARTCLDNGLGAIVHLELGGKLDPRFGAPIEVRGTVKAVTRGRFAFEGPMAAGTRIDMGATAVLQVDGIDIVVTSGRFQAYDQMFFKHAGIDPASRQVLAVKSAQHFRAAFAPIASEILVVDDGGGLTSGNYKLLPYENVRRPIYPLDLD